MHSNKLKSANEFHHLPSLKELNITHNQITSIQGIDDDTFTGLFSLKVLDISWNLLEKMDDAFARLINLETLSLANNNIKVLSESVFNSLTNIFWLDLSGNSLIKIDSNLFANLINMNSLILRENPIVNKERSHAINLCSVNGLNCTVFI
jgi:Leucine-rich repeat (LRR) protein